MIGLLRACKSGQCGVCRRRAPRLMVTWQRPHSNISVRARLSMAFQAPVADGPSVSVVVDSRYERFVPKAPHALVRIEHVGRVPGHAGIVNTVRSAMAAAKNLMGSEPDYFWHAGFARASQSTDDSAGLPRFGAPRRCRRPGARVSAFNREKGTPALWPVHRPHRRPCLRFVAIAPSRARSAHGGGSNSAERKSMNTRIFGASRCCGRYTAEMW